LYRYSQQYVTEPFLKQWIDMLAFFSGFPAEAGLALPAAVRLVTWIHGSRLDTDWLHGYCLSSIEPLFYCKIMRKVLNPMWRARWARR
jgi:hypothetical protein